MKRNKQIKTPIKTSYLAFALFVFACFAVSPASASDLSRRLLNEQHHCVR